MGVVMDTQALSELAAHIEAKLPDAVRMVCAW